MENLEISFLEHEEIGSAESTNSSAKVGAKCFIEQTGKVNCSDIIYEDEKSWRKSRLQIDLLIKVLKNKINDLKDIKKHLRENKPIHMKDYEEVGSIEDEVDADKATRRNQRKHSSEIGRRNKTHLIEPKPPALDDSDGVKDMSFTVTDKNEVTLPFDRISYDFSSLSTMGKESLITEATTASAAITQTTTTSPATTKTSIVTPQRLNHKPKTNRTQSTGHHHRNHNIAGRRGQFEELIVSSSTSSSIVDSIALSTLKPKDRSTTRLPKPHSTLSSISGQTDNLSTSTSRTSTSILATEVEAIDVTTRVGGLSSDEDNIWKESTEKVDASNRTPSSN